MAKGARSSGRRRPRVRHPVVLIGCVLALLAGVFVIGSALELRGTVYTAAQIRAGLAASPPAWVGRTVLVRATIYGGSGGQVCAPRMPRASCRWMYLYGFGAPGRRFNGAFDGLSLVVESPDLLYRDAVQQALLSHSGVFGHLPSGLWRLAMGWATAPGHDGVYRIRLVAPGHCASSANIAPSPPCSGVLLSRRDG